jgi:hypothetical protein
VVLLVSCNSTIILIFEKYNLFKLKGTDGVIYWFGAFGYLISMSIVCYPNYSYFVYKYNIV